MQGGLGQSAEMAVTNASVIPAMSKSLLIMVENLLGVVGLS